MDILGFEELASDLAEKSKIRPEIVRAKFVKNMENKLQDFKKNVSLEYNQIGPDSWLLQTDDDILKILECVRKILDCEDPPLEMAIGKTKHDPEDKITHKDYTISLIKKLTSSYKNWYKQRYGKSIKCSFIVFADDIYSELCSSRNICLNISNAHCEERELHYISKADQKRNHIGVVINPLVFKNLALRKVYGFKRVNDYWTLKEKLRSHSYKNNDFSIAIHGIYGYHDILIQSYEPSSESGKTRLTLRLWPILSDENDFNREIFGLAEVNSVMKYHGIKSEELETRFSSEDIHEYKKYFKAITTGDEIDNSVLNEMLKKNICIRTQYDLSDISDEEHKKGCTEFLVLVEVEEISDLAIPPEDFFEEKILNSLLDEHGHYVRTVERLRPNKESFIRAHFIIHVVGYLKDLNEIILNHIHRKSINYEEFQCKTQVVIPAEQITENRLPILLEESIPPTKANRILDIIKICQKKINDEYIIPPSRLIYPFAVYTISEHDRDNITKLYEKFDSMIFDYYNKDTDYCIKLYRFLYGIAEVLALAKLNDSRGIASCKVFKSERSQFINTVGEKVEDTLKQVFHEVMKDCELKEDEFNSLVNLAIELLMNQKGHFDCKIINIGNSETGLRAVEGICRNEEKITKARQKAKVIDTLTDETIDNNIELLCKIYSELVKWFAPSTPKDMYKKPMEITLMNLKDFSSVRNLFSHGLGTEDEKVQYIYDNLSDILHRVFQGIRYLEHINKRIYAK